MGLVSRSMDGGGDCSTLLPLYITFVALLFHLGDLIVFSIMSASMSNVTLLNHNMFYGKMRCTLHTSVLTISAWHWIINLLTYE